MGCAQAFYTKDLMKSHPPAENHSHLNCAPAGGRRRRELDLGARLQEPRVEAAARSRAANAASSSGRAMPERQAVARPVIDRAAGFPPEDQRRRNRLLRARHRRGFDSAAVGNRSGDSRRLSSVRTLSTSASRPPSESASVMETYTRSIAPGDDVRRSRIDLVAHPCLRRSPRSPEPTGSGGNRRRLRRRDGSAVSAAATAASTAADASGRGR
jgi:hypothetical protein